MTTGALIFAFDNEQTDYVAMAGWSAENIHRHLGIPVAVVTDAPDRARACSGIDRVIEAVPESGGTRYFEDYQSTVTWHNAGRVDAYSLSPWDRTLVLDADYVVASQQLKPLLKCDQEFLCYKDAMSVNDDLAGLNVFGHHKFPMWWATVMYFQKGNHARFIFESMHMIRQNWQHYRDIYGIDRATYRNDFALSIALGIVSGHTIHVDTIPGCLVSVMPEQRLTQLGPDDYLVEYQNSSGKKQYVEFVGMDFHAMGKRDLGGIVETSSRTRLLDSSH
jgi:hypothetical protein